jgi:hypothetical protein
VGKNFADLHIFLKKNCGEGSLLISNKKYVKDGNVLSHFGLKLKVFPGSLTDLSA